MPSMRDERGRFVSGGGSSGGGFFGSLFGGFSARAKVVTNPKKVIDAEKRGTIWSLGRAGSYIMGIARKSIGTSPLPSDPGNPPHTRKGVIRHAIQFDVEKEQGRVVIGPVASEFGALGQLHEFGGTRKGKLGKGARTLLSRYGSEFTAKVTGISEKDLLARLGTLRYPKRAFMGPALAISRERLPKFWAQSVRGG